MIQISSVSNKPRQKVPGFLISIKIATKALIVRFVVGTAITGCIFDKKILKTICFREAVFWFFGHN